MEKVNVVPLHKKEVNRQILKNYLPVSLLPICGNIFPLLIFTGTFEFLMFDNWISPNKSGFTALDS